MTEPLLSSVSPSQQWPAIPNLQNVMLMAIQYQLDRTQWYSAEKITELQFDQANLLLAHAARTVPFYSQSLSKLLADHRGKIDRYSWQQIPVLERNALQQAGSALVSTSIPPEHQPVSKGLTSGSTGRPVEVHSTPITQLFWLACTLRDHLWHQRDLSAKLAVIRFFEKAAIGLEKAVSSDQWGAATTMYQHQGKSVMLDIRNSIKDQVAWLKKEQPAYLLSYPSNLEALAEYCISNGVSLHSLKQVRTLGEKLSAKLRLFCKTAWDVDVVDVYSAEEIGYIALQCPTGRHYHVQSEHVLLEVLGDDGEPCRPGEVGRVVITSLSNFAKPLIRYAIGDYAEVGHPCSCGRGLPTIKSIVGRARNMFQRPDGSKFWPVIPKLPPECYVNLPSVRQLQYVQKALDWIEVRIGAGGKHYPPEVEAALITAIHNEYGYPYRVTFSYMESIPLTPRVKYEDCLSEIV